VKQVETIQALLQRPAEQRAKEFKYRFGQAVVFGLPVLALQYFGPLLGWVEAGRWVGLFQLLLAGWVVYVAAAGLVFEGILLPRKMLADLLVAGSALLIYLLSAVTVLHLLVLGSEWFPPLFYLSVLLLIPWTGFRWWRLSRRPTTTQFSR